MDTAGSPASDNVVKTNEASRQTGRYFAEENRFMLQFLGEIRGVANGLDTDIGESGPAGVQDF
jgi:hypothetical protein